MAALPRDKRPRPVSRPLLAPQLRFETVAFGSPACISLPSSKNACARFTGMPSAALAKEGMPFSHPVRAWFTGMSLSVLRQKRLHVYK